MKFFAVILLPILLFFTGCSSVQTSELYSLPKLPDEYLSLQALIDTELDLDSEYSAPIRGNNRQSVQLFNLDSSGESEAIAFFRTAEGTLKIIIYSFDGVNYAPVSTITGEASSIGRIEYSDLNNDGVFEILVSWDMGGGISMLNVYSELDWSSSVLLTAQSYGFRTTSLLSSSSKELSVLVQDADGKFSVQLYTLSHTGEMSYVSAMLSPFFVSATRMSEGKITETTNSLIIEGKNAENQTVTDVFIIKDGTIANVSKDPDLKPLSIRNYEVYSEDIDDDGIVEIPYTRAVKDSDYLLFDWRTVKPHGTTYQRLTTYHNYNDGWYFVLPDELRYTFSARRINYVYGESAMVVSMIDGDEYIDLFSIYTLTGQNRQDRAEYGGRVILAQDDATIYSVLLHTDYFSLDDIKDRFHTIQYEWISPVM